jgi:alpha-glucosidase
MTGPSNTNALALPLLVLVTSGTAVAEDVISLVSPAGTIRAALVSPDDGRLSLSISREEQPVLDPSPLGIVIDGVDLGRLARLGQPTSREIHETYAWRGVKNEAVNHCRAYEVPVRSGPDAIAWTLEVKVFEDGLAYRYRVPGEGTRQIKGEASGWRIPRGATVWVQHNTANYEGEYRPYAATEVPAEADGKPLFVGFPATIELPNGQLALITEACLYDYSGMTLLAGSEGLFQGVFQDDPDGWQLDGEVLSPWRVTVICQDLNALVNSDLVFNLGPAPDPTLFPQGINTNWIEPGKGLITWGVFGNDGAQWYRQKWFVDMCAAMNCEYLLVDGGWRTEKWGFLRDGGDLWERLAELCQYAQEKQVGIFVWHAYPEGRNDGPGLTDPIMRRNFFRKCKSAGVRGVKIDFFDSERCEIIKVYEQILRETAELQLMVNFHGANKPTGEVRTWPHEITREGIREQEYLLWSELPLVHYGALPFSRLVVGHGDFLPTFVRPQYLKNTTATFQLATSIIFTSPFICWPDHPEAYLESPFLNLIRTMPPTWDETSVLEGSKIGQLVAFARRSGDTWFVAALNCQAHECQFQFSTSFLGPGPYRAELIRDGEGGHTIAQIDAGQTIDRGQQLTVTMRSGGGCVAKFSKPTRYTD